VPENYEQSPNGNGNGNGADAVNFSELASDVAQQAPQQPAPPAPVPQQPQYEAPQPQSYQQPPQQPSYQPQQPQAPVEPPRTVLVEEMGKHGMNFAPGTSDDQLLQHLSNIAATNAAQEQELRNLRQAQPILNEYAQHAADFREWQRQQAEAQKQPEAPAEPKWQAPEYDESWLNRAEWNEESGRYIAKTAADYDAANGLNNYLAHKRKVDRMLAENPYEAVKQAGLADDMAKLREELRNEIRDEQQAMLRDMAIQQYQEKVISDNRGAFYFLDDQGQPVPDGQGGFHLTPVGRAFRDAAAQAEQYTDPGDREKVFNYAMLAANAAAKDIYAGGQGISLDPQQLPTNMMQTLQSAAQAYQQATQQQQPQNPQQPQQQPVAQPTPAQVRQQNQNQFMNRVHQYQQQQEYPLQSSTSIAQAAANADMNEDTWESSVTQAAQYLNQG
jgi:hypothetical protein